MKFISPHSKLINWFERISGWVSAMLSEDDNIDALLYFLNLIYEFSKLNNFNGMAAFYSGIRKSSIGNSKKVIHSLTMRHRQIYDNAESLFTDKSNYKRYRETIKSASLPCIPFVGVFLRDMTVMLKVKFIEGGMILFEKCRELADLITDFTKYQMRYDKIEEIPCVQRWLSGLVKEKLFSEVVQRETVSNQFNGMGRSLLERFRTKIQNYSEMQSPNLAQGAKVW